MSETLLFADNAAGSLAFSINTVVTSVTLTAGHGSRFPTPAAGQAFIATIQEGANFEIVRVTARSMDTLTVVRAQEGTTARSFGASASFEARITAGSMGAHVQGPAAVAAGSVLGRSTAGTGRAEQLVVASPLVVSGGQLTLPIAAPLVVNSGQLDLDEDALAASTIASQPYGMRNLIINGNPLVNQRGYVSGAATGAALQYTLDRWRVVTSGQSVSWTDSAGVRTVTAPVGGMEQVIEGASITGGTYTLSWTGTASATVNGVGVTSGAQVTLTGGSNATVRMSGGTWSLLQLEPGTRATRFEQRHAALEMALCERYHGRLYTMVASPVAGSMSVSVMTPAKMRVNPAVVVLDINQSNCLTWSVLVASNNAVQIDATFAGAGFSGRTLSFDSEF